MEIINIKEKYNEWRLIANEFIKEEGKKAYDCGESSVRENFSEFAGIKIEFEEMFELEKEWEEENTDMG